jgi:hypothetical protein
MKTCGGVKAYSYFHNSWPRYFPPGKDPSTYWRLGESQSRSGRCGKEKNLTPARIRIPVVQLLARRYID